MVAIRVGSFVAEWPDRPCSFVVLGVRRDAHGQAAFWAAHEDRVLWFDDREIALGPFGALGPVPPSLQQGDVLPFAEGTLRHGDEVLFARGAVPVEDTRVPRFSLAPAVAEARAEDLMMALDDLEPDSGWLGDAFARSRRLFVAAAHAAEDATAAAQKLVGLGEGLTPRGDDYLGGVMLVAHAQGLSPPFSIDALSEVASATTLVSQAHLFAHARGHAARACRDLLAAVAAGGDLHTPIRALLELGHTSGRDVALGIADGLVACALGR